MKDITQYLKIWANCCRELWDGWFANLDNGDDEFFEVENALFSALVLSQLEISPRPNLDDIYPRLTATYINDVRAQRSVCRVQKAGNIFCAHREVEHLQGQTFSVKSIDCLGTMLDGAAYIELALEGGEYVLEPLENLSIAIDKA